MDWGADDEKVVGSGVVDWLCVEESNLFWDRKVPRCSSSWLTVTKSDVFDDGKVLGRGWARTGSYHLHHVLLSCTTQNLDQLPGNNERKFH